MNPNDTTSNPQQFAQQGSQPAVPAPQTNSNDLTNEEVFPPQVFGPTKPAMQNMAQANPPSPALPQQFAQQGTQPAPNPFLPPQAQNIGQPYPSSPNPAPPISAAPVFSPLPANPPSPALPQQFAQQGTQPAPNPFLPPQAQNIGQPYANNLSPAPAAPTPPLASDNPFLQPPLTPTTSYKVPPSSQPLPNNAARQELIDHLKKANNVLVTVSNNPSVDQLTAAIGITLILNKLDKHATAVYSGKTPSTLEFLQPEKTIEKNTDSLRDFIIALDKAKADKLRYKVEDKFVKIFITPYHTSISEDDLVFSQGDFNVDVILALGVHQREELDQAITAHGRILHDSVTVSVNNKTTSDIGLVNWFEADASSLCEMLVGLIEPLQGEKAILDNQIATSFLTGVVAETERFSNAKTTPRTMNVAATLMKAGANQQLVASKLEEPAAIPEDEFDKVKMDELAKHDKGDLPAPVPSRDGSLEIEHRKSEEADRKKLKTLQELEKENNVEENPDEQDDYGNLAKIHIDEHGKMHAGGEINKPTDTSPVVNTEQKSAAPSNMITEPPSIGGAMSSNSSGAQSVPAVDQPSEDNSSTLKAKTIQPLDQETKDKTLSELEDAVHSRHKDQELEAEKPDVEQARDAINKASSPFDNSRRLEPISALNANPIDLNLRDGEDAPASEDFPSQLVGPDTGPAKDPTASASSEPGSPPPVPPPLMPPVV